MKKKKTRKRRRIPDWIHDDTVSPFKDSKEPDQKKKKILGERSISWERWSTQPELHRQASATTELKGLCVAFVHYGFHNNGQLRIQSRRLMELGAATCLVRVERWPPSLLQALSERDDVVWVCGLASREAVERYIKNQKICGPVVSKDWCLAVLNHPRDYSRPSDAEAFRLPDLEKEVVEREKPQGAPWRSSQPPPAAGEDDIPVVTVAATRVEPLTPRQQKGLQYLFCQKGKEEEEESRQQHNLVLIDEFKKRLETRPHQAGGEFAARHYQRLVQALERCREKIRDGAHARELLGLVVTSNMRQKIDEILQSGHLTANEVVDPATRARVELMKVWGAGEATVDRWLSEGIMSVEQLRVRSASDQTLLTDNQCVGLRLYNELLLRIPRAEVEALSEVVREAIRATGGSTLQCETVGSYRRRKQTCGDIDILITDNSGRNVDGILEQVLLNLPAGFVTDSLTRPGSKWMGVVRLNSTRPHRRMDIKVYPVEQYPTALLYFTGSDHFNRSMRFHAGKIGFRLSDKALICRGEKSQNGRAAKVQWQGQDWPEGVPIPVTCEMDIFDLLGLKWREPHERNGDSRLSN